MKKVHLLAFLALQSATALFSQTQNKPDTMTIRIGGEHISLPVPKEGNKTTINLEDSVNIIQISVARTAKNKIGPAVPAPKSPRQAGVRDPRKTVSWFNEVEIGATALMGKRKTFQDDPFTQIGIGLGGTNFYLNDYYPVSGNRAIILKMTPKNVDPGWTVGFTIREKRRPIFKSEFYMITGSRFRFSRYISNGDYDRREVKVTRDSAGNPTFYPDSVYSKRTGEYKTVSNIISVIVPFIVERELKTKSKHSIKLAAGMNVLVSVNFARTKNVTPGITASQSDGEGIHFQPIIRASIDRTSFYVSYTLNKTVMGYGGTEKLTGHFANIGLSFKLY